MVPPAAHCTACVTVPPPGLQPRSLVMARAWAGTAAAAGCSAGTPIWSRQLLQQAGDMPNRHHTRLMLHEHDMHQSCHMPADACSIISMAWVRLQFNSAAVKSAAKIAVSMQYCSTARCHPRNWHHADPLALCSTHCSPGRAATDTSRAATGGPHLMALQPPALSYAAAGACLSK